MLSLCRTSLAAPRPLLSLTLNESVGRGRHEPWAILSLTRRSPAHRWGLGVREKNGAVFLRPLPDGFVAGSVVAKQFLARGLVRSSTAVRVVSVNGVVAASAGNVRRELNRCNTVVMHLALQASVYRRALLRKQKEHDTAAEGGGGGSKHTSELQKGEFPQDVVVNDAVAAEINFIAEEGEEDVKNEKRSTRPKVQSECSDSKKLKMKKDRKNSTQKKLRGSVTPITRTVDGGGDAGGIGKGAVTKAKESARDLTVSL